MTTGDAPQILDLPIGINASGTRRETDPLGTIDVPAGRYWGPNATVVDSRITASTASS